MKHFEILIKNVLYLNLPVRTLVLGGNIEFRGCVFSLERTGEIW